MGGPRTTSGVGESKEHDVWIIRRSEEHSRGWVN